MNETHDPGVRSWIPSANEAGTDFPLQNLPFGVFREKRGSGNARVGIALGDQIIDVGRLHAAQPFDGPAAAGADSCRGDSLNRFLGTGRATWSALRHEVFRRFREDAVADRETTKRSLVPQSEAAMILPIGIGDYTDFYTSIFHATNVGSMFRPDNPLLPNFKHLPIAYHGRASSVVVSGTSVRRPSGQTKADDAPLPSFGPTRLLDYELEIGIVIGPGNPLGSPIPLNTVQDHIFGLCLLNDWSARDLQKWEYQPLGPFLAKNFATTVSPWIVSLEALEPFRTNAFKRPPGDPTPLPYLSSENDRTEGGLAISLEVHLSTEGMKQEGIPPHRLSRGTFADMYWTIGQMVAHHASNGCNLQPGDLLGSGTVSGKDKETRGCLLELTWRGKEPIALPNGESRTFLMDGDEITLTGFCERKGYRRIGFGDCVGTILPAVTGAK